MKKQTVLAALATLACTAALAQAPLMPNTTPPAEVSPPASGGVAAENAQTRVNNRTMNDMTAPAAVVGDGSSAAIAEVNPSATGGRAAANAEEKVAVRLMDSNHDGMVSNQEVQTYHANAWNSTVPASNTGVSTADIDKLNRQITVVN